MQLIEIYLEWGLENDALISKSQFGLNDDELDRLFRESHEEDLNLGIKHNQGNFEELIAELKKNGLWKKYQFCL
ncbi:MAG: hypothetical protein IJQ68_09055 [Methanobrevibacter sp.]|uniref:hypothetical protein n=1 Tax=Methanobrevibacter sp. TaxID=66852 RepID=UPI0025CD03A6|nr:hypothetical protein [Methanobrevibacter sp.]MBR0272116.1 hypothetical protein [Methanobrevibacter sp.]